MIQNKNKKMKNKNFWLGVLFLGVVLTLSLNVKQIQAICTDTDGGNLPYTQGTTTTTYASAPTTVDNDTCSGNNLTEYYCNGSARAYQNYTCPCNSGKCVECNVASDCASVPQCKVASCSSSNTCSYTNATNGTDCATGTCQNGLCVSAPSCTGYSFNLNSGGSRTATVTTDGTTNRWSAVCTKFSCSDWSCSYNSSSYTQNYSAVSFSGSSFSSQSMDFTNNSGATQKRICSFSVWNSATPTNIGTCSGTDTVCSTGYTWNGSSCVSATPLPTAPTVTFTKTSPITLGNPTTLGWTVTGSADSCTASTTSSNAGTWTGSKLHVNGQAYTENVFPTTPGTKTYKLSCSNAGGTTEKTVDVVVNAVCTGTIPSGSTMCSGDDVGLISNLDWQYAGAYSSNCDDTRKCQYYNIAPVGNFGSLTCNNGNLSVYGWAYDGDDSSASIDVHFYRGSTIISGNLLKACKANISRPDVNATYGITGNHGFDCIVASGLAAGDYTVSAWAINIGTGANPKIGERSVTCMPPSASSLSFSASPLNVDSGGFTVLSWTASNMITCNASGDWVGIKPFGLPYSETMLNLTENKSYTLTCDGLDGFTHSKTVNVAVNVPPPVTYNCSPSSKAVACVGKCGEPPVESYCYGSDLVKYDDEKLCNDPGGCPAFLCDACPTTPNSSGVTNWKEINP